LAARRPRVVDGAGVEVHGRLQKDVGRLEAAPVQFLFEAPGRTLDVFELGGGLQVRAPLEEADIDALDLEQGDQVEGRPVVQEREGEIGTGEFGFHARSRLG